MDSFWHNNHLRLLGAIRRLGQWGIWSPSSQSFHYIQRSRHRRLHQFHRKFLETCKGRPASIPSKERVLSVSFGKIHVHEAVPCTRSGSNYGVPSTSWQPLQSIEDGRRERRTRRYWYWEWRSGGEWFQLIEIYDSSFIWIKWLLNLTIACVLFQKFIILYMFFSIVTHFAYL